MVNGRTVTRRDHRGRGRPCAIRRAASRDRPGSKIWSRRSLDPIIASVPKFTEPVEALWGHGQDNLRKRLRYRKKAKGRPKNLRNFNALYGNNRPSAPSPTPSKFLPPDLGVIEPEAFKPRRRMDYANIRYR